MPDQYKGAMEAGMPEDQMPEESPETEEGEDSGKSVLVPTEFFANAKEGDIVQMRVGKQFGKELELMLSESSAPEKPEMPMRASMEEDLRQEMLTNP